MRSNIVDEEIGKIKEELRAIEGFIDVKEKEVEIKQRLKYILECDPYYKNFANKLRELVESHPFFSNNGTTGDVTKKVV